MNQLYVFNPDHDLALAHGMTHYVSPASAVQFATDAAVLPAWIFDDGYLLVNKGVTDSDFLSLCKKLNIRSRWVTNEGLTDILREDNRIEVVPWGWNYTFRQKMADSGVDAACLPTLQDLENIRRLSHRRLTIAALQFLNRKNAGNDYPLPLELTTIEAVDDFVKVHGDVVLKMPWSGSGRGLRRVVGEMTEHQRGWARQSIRKHGCVMGEIFRNVVQDFAMEFHCGAEVGFCGYSLFSTHNGVYQGNVLMSDDAIETHLAQFISPMQIAETQHSLLQFLEAEVRPFYKGPVGVDMFVFQEDNQYRLDPCVEINLRMTMGLLATVFCKKYLEKESKGLLKMRHSPKSGALLAEKRQFSAQTPPVIRDGKLVSGHLFSTPIHAETHYAVEVSVGM